ncbi:MAG: ribosome maturation factor RimP [Rubrivivax sp.]
MPTAEELAARVGWREAIDATVNGFGYELVDVERAERGLLRVTIDRVPGRVYLVAPDSDFVTVEDCEQVTRQLQYVLEVEGLAYARLEVSSPGLDRLLRNDADLARFEGQAVSVALKLPFDGRKNWQGVLAQAQPMTEAGATGDTAENRETRETHATGTRQTDDHQGAAWQLVFDDRGTERVLGFRMHEVREARLVPVLDFKGRRSAPGVDGG